MQPQINSPANAKNADLQSANTNTTAKSSLISRNVTIGTHRTSIRLEPEMWVGLRELCRREHATLHDIATLVAERKTRNTSLTAAIRVFIMAYFRAASTEEGHSRAGHGPGGSFMVSLITKNISEHDHTPQKQTMIRPIRITSLR